MRNQLLPRVARSLVAVSIGCVVIGSLMAILAIWGEVSDDVFWKTLATIGVVFLGTVLSASCLLVVNAFASR